jgi:hypothetical protein
MPKEEEKNEKENRRPFLFQNLKPTPFPIPPITIIIQRSLPTSAPTSTANSINNSDTHTHTHHIPSHPHHPTTTTVQTPIPTFPTYQILQYHCILLIR